MNTYSKIFILVIFIMIFSVVGFGEEVTGYYYTDDGKTACMPTAKLKDVLHSYNQYKSEVEKLRLELSVYKEISKKEIENCYNKCNKYVSMVSSDDKIDIKNVLYFVGYSVVIFGGGFLAGYLVR